ncbi:hypothetical protein NEMBOFW57_000792 [Staphylotrichum longicolle]|uniref:PLC-like phosphodiesterase n=1 Tax=Staphylotrichum longicolle TaxID=669026 RepID=A0AAD4F0C6_9PEZI|nr:hypothetical protein NEMBOFW57_000792 [Staphylotrichum longicolle]
MLRLVAALLAVAALPAITPTALASPQGGTAAATTAQQPAGTPAAPVACNNSPELCSRAYSNITHMGAHDSAFLRDASTGNSIAGNQYYNATVALSAGIRLLQAQVHLSSSTLRLCHTLCELLDAGPLDAWLAKIKAWLDGNRNEVVTLLLVNADNQPASAFAAAFSSSGIASYAFTPPSSSSSNNNNTTIAWPTLQALIAANTRLVTFIAGITPDANHPYLLNEFDHAFETPYNVTSLAAFGCALDRPGTANSSAAALAAGLLPLVNHFAYASLAQGVEIPDASDIDTTNSPSETQVGALGRHVSGCVAEWGGSSPCYG